MDTIKVNKAVLHNLKGIDLEIPKRSFVCVTGVSGSGKTSAMFDILYEESRRTYMELAGISADYRQPEECECKGFDSMEGLVPVIAVKQENRDNNPRSSVGTKTGIYDMLRWLFFLDGKYLCGNCGGYADASGACDCGRMFPKKDIGLLSYNSPLGMCENCSGNGIVTSMDLDSILAENPGISILGFYSAVGEKMGVKRSFVPPVKFFCKSYGLDPESKFLDMDGECRDDFIFGVDNSKIRFPGIDSMVKGWIRRGKVNEAFARNEICPVCNGMRLSDNALSMVISGMNIGLLASLGVSELKRRIADLLNARVLSDASEKICGGITGKIEMMEGLGLGYLSLFRTMPTLSGGEAQRLSLMTQLDMKMSGVAYVFDEPTHGLHQVEKQRLTEKLESLRDNGNTVIVIEHDIGTVQHSEYVINFGPGAGKHGGEITFSGNTQDFLDSSIYGKHKLDFSPRKHDSGVEKGAMLLKNVNTNNLKNVDVSIPLGKIVGIAGVSGSGKTSLITKTLYPILKSLVNGFESDEDDTDDADFTDSGCLSAGRLEIARGYVSSVFMAQQKPIGRNSKSTPATYLGLLREIQKEFSELEEAKNRKLKTSDFSYNSGGACKTCGGKGFLEVWTIDSYFSREICPECGGGRYAPEILEVEYSGLSIRDILERDFAELRDVFSSNRKIVKICDTVIDMGVGYLAAGQSLNTLSGGEAQRMKLAKNLTSSPRRNCLYIFDEPTIGLSDYDVGIFMKTVGELSRHNTVIIIEHDVNVLSACGWLIELGPGAGENGGEIISQGTAADLATDKRSVIGRFLKI